MTPTVHRVYWTEAGKAMSTASSSIDTALRYCEELRNRRANGDDISFITTASENPDCVSLSGVAAPSEDYNWVKRRGGRK